MHNEQNQWETHLKSLLSDGQTDLFFAEIQQFPLDSDLKNRCRLLQFQSNELEKKVKLNTINLADTTAERNRIQLVLLDLTDEICQSPDVKNYFLEKPTPQYKTNFSPNSFQKSPFPKEKSLDMRHIFWFGAAFLAAIVVAAIFIPNQTTSQRETFRIVAAVAAAAVGATMPTFFEWQHRTVFRIGGATLLFGVIYAVNPARRAEGNFLLAIKTVDSTSATVKLPKDLRLDFRCGSFFYKISADADGNFSISLPESFREKPLSIEVEKTEFPFIVGRADGVQIFDKSLVNLPVRYVNLDRIAGRLTNFCCQNPPLANVKIALVHAPEISTTTDADGTFLLKVPPQYQREKTEILIEKTGFETQRITTQPYFKQAVVKQLVPK